MTFESIKPCPALQPFVKGYWAMDINTWQDGVKQRVAPTGHVEIIFYPFQKIQRVNPQSGEKRLLPHSLICGQSLQFFDLLPASQMQLFSITLQPQAAGLFLRFPASELYNKSLSLQDVYGNEARELEDRICSAKSTRARVAIAEQFLLKQLDCKQLFDFKRINQCVHSLNAQRAQLTVHHLASVACLSEKQFERTFTSLVGAKPKEFLRIVRYQNVLYTQQTTPFKRLSELGLACGYYDQAHFINEFKRFTGYTPSECFELCPPHSDYFSTL